MTESVKMGIEMGHLAESVKMSIEISHTQSSVFFVRVCLPGSWGMHGCVFPVWLWYGVLGEACSHVRNGLLGVAYLAFQKKSSNIECLFER